MKLVIDASIVFTAIIGKGVTKELIFSDNLDLYVPDFFFEEIKKHENRIKELSKLSSEEFNDLVNKIKSKITPISRKEFDMFLEKANRLIDDKDDTEYIALALKLKIPIWSNDPHFKKQQEIKIFTTTELVDHLKSLGLF